MSKSEDNLDMKVLKTSSCKTLSGKSTLTYQLGCTSDNEIHLRITKNSGGGFFSDEWISLDDILQALKKRSVDSPIMSHFISPLLKGKSSNTSGFIMAVLSHLKLIRPLPKKKRLHELLDAKPFLDQMEKLTTSGSVKKRATTKKKATSRNNKTASS